MYACYSNLINSLRARTTISSMYISTEMPTCGVIHIVHAVVGSRRLLGKKRLIGRLVNYHVAYGIKSFAAFFLLLQQFASSCDVASVQLG